MLKAMNLKQTSITLAVTALLDRISRLASLTRDDALKENEQIYVLLHSLYLESESKKSIIEKAWKDTQEQYVKNNEAKVRLKTSIREAQEQVAAHNQKLAELKESVVQLQLVIAGEQMLLAALRLQKEEIERRKIDLAKWFWVPGYNLYLVGRTIDDAVTQIPNLERRIGKLSGEMTDLGKQKAKVESGLQAIKTELWKKSNSLATMASYSTHFQAEEKKIAKDLVTLSASKNKLEEFSTLTKSAEERNRTVQTFIGFLDQNVELKDALGSTYVAYRKVFIDLGAILDKY